MFNNAKVNKIYEEVFNTEFKGMGFASPFTGPSTLFNTTSKIKILEDKVEALKYAVDCLLAYLKLEIVESSAKLVVRKKKPHGG